MAGQRGPLPKPAVVHQLFGNPSKKPAADLTGGIQPEVALPPPPDHLSPAAVAHYLALGAELLKLGLVTVIDGDKLAAYCQAYARWRDIELLLTRDLRGFHDALWDTTPNGYKQISVLEQLRRGYLAEMDRLGDHFGLSPAARGRVQSSGNQSGQQLSFDGMIDPMETFLQTQATARGETA